LAYGHDEIPSPNQFQRELNLARRGLSRTNQSSITNPLAGGVEDIPVIQRRREICVIEDIEKLYPELHKFTLPRPC
jgi:hypothetical protein